VAKKLLDCGVLSHHTEVHSFALSPAMQLFL